ncbi:discoidin domain-containing protein, partial [Nostoc sp.]|uniref:discoidin domain-containing protein n=1 Tax=Nostoc sp. TaxID=1180 RepID=UPI002FF50621
GVNVSNGYVYEDRELYLDAGKYWLELNGTGATDPSFNVQIITAPLTTTAMNLGDTVSGTIAKKGEQDSFTFTGTAGQQLFYDALQPTNYFQYSIYDPTGRKILNSADSRGDRRPQDSLTLTMNGTYKVTIDGSGEDTGAYKFRFLDRNTAAVATIGGSALTGNFDEMGIGSTSYRFNVMGNQTIKIDGQSTGQAYNYWILYGRDGTQITYDQIYNSQNVALTAGEYWLVMQGNGAVNNNYSIKLTSISSTPSSDSTPIDYTLNTVVKGNVNSFYVMAGSADLSSYPAYRAFDGHLTGEDGFWAANGPTPSIQIDLGSAKSVATYSLLSRWNGEYNQSPHQWALAGSNDGTNFTTIDTRTQEGVWGVLETRNYTLATPDSYRYYKWTFTAVPGQSIISVQEITLADSAGKSVIDNKKIYSFDGITGQDIWFDSQSNSSNLKYTLITPSGREIATNSTWQDNSEIALGETGKYKFVVEGTNSLFSAYQFQLVSYANSATNPTPITLGDSVSGTFGGGGLEAKFYRFTSTVDNQHIFIDTTGGNVNNYLYVMSPDGVTLTYSRLAAYYDGGPIDFYLPKAGEYTLVISGRNTGTYTYNVSVLAPTSTTTAYTIGKEQSGIISIKGQQDTYTFSGSKGQQLFYDALGGDYLYFTLIDPNGKTIVNRADGRNDQGSEPSNGLTLKLDGTYKIVIGGSDIGYYGGATSHTGNYSFRLLDKNGATTPQVFVGDTIGGTAADVFDNNGLGSKIYRLTITNPTDSLYFEALKTGGNYIIYDTDGNYLASRDMNTAYGRELTLAKGDYMIVMQGTGSSIPYQFRINRPANSIPEAIEFDTVVSGTITDKGAVRNYTFTGIKGQQIFYDALGGDYLYFTVIDPTGKVVVNRADARNDRGSDPSNGLTLQMDGTYKLIIGGTDVGYYSDYSYPHTGNYSFRLLDKNGATTPQVFVGDTIGGTAADVFDN